MDSHRSTLFLVETSFSYKLKVSKRDESKKEEEVLMRYGDYKVNVKDIYIKKGDVLLHGFLLSKTNHPRGVIVYGYGGFRISLLPSFPMSTRVLLDKGYTLLITNLGGGL